MKAADAWMAIVVVALAAGCLQKPSPWVPDGRLPDGASDGETAVGDGPITGDGGDVLGDVCRGGSPCPPDADRQDGELLPEDNTGQEAWETVELEMLPDADVPPVEPGPPLLLPGVFVGRSAGGEFTLHPVGPGGLMNGATMTGGKWMLTASRAGQ